MKSYYIDIRKLARGYYWNLYCRANGELVASGREPYASNQSCIRGFKKQGKSWVNMDNVDLKK